MKTKLQIGRHGLVCMAGMFLLPLLALASLLLPAAQAQTNPPAVVVDLMVVYTPQALNDAGGEARLHAQIDEFVAEANRCFSNSQINARFNLVHRGVVPYTESGDWNTDRDRLRTSGDGYLDDVHRLRNLYKADLVMLHSWGTTANSFIYSGDAGDGFCVVGRHPALTIRMLPTHELAHNFGPVDRVMPTSASQRLANRFVAEGVLYHTIVSYEPGISVPYFSGPNVLYRGIPTGSAADNDVRLMNQNAPSIARFRVATNRFEFTAARYFASENIGTAMVEVLRTGDTNTAASVDVQVKSGTAQAGTDFIAQTNRLTFLPGVESLACPVTVLDDAVCQGERTVKLSLRPPPGDATYTTTRGNALGLQDTAELVIQDNDPGFVLRATKCVVSETITILDNQRPGSLDAAFNPAGGPNCAVLVLAVRPDDRLLCGGLFTRFNGLDHAGLVQLNPDGSVDADFHPVRIAIGPDREDGEVYGNVMAIAEQSDGRILVGGEFATVNGVCRPNLARFNADGTLDPGFLPAAPNGRILRMALQPDGKILLGGCFTEIAGQWHPLVARLNPNGSLDPSFRFSVSGFVQLTALVLQPDGKILVAYYNASFVGMCARLNPDGTRDTSFRRPALPTFSVPNILAVLPNGQILMGGDFMTVNGRPRRLLVRLNPDGTLNESYTTPFDRNGLAASLVPLPDGRVLVGGMLSITNTPGRQNLVRLNADGSRDRSFDVGSGPNDFVFAVSAHASGSLYLGGAFVEVNGQPAPCLACVRCDGTNPRLESPIRSESGMRLILRGLPGIYSLESSSDLHTWTPLDTVTNRTGQAECVDGPPIGQTTRFYRAVVK